MKINLRSNKVAVEKNKKAPKSGPAFLVMPEGDEFSGIIRYIGPDASKDLQVGQKVYFGNEFQNTRIGGVDLCIMSDTQVFAFVEE
jgi:co-chaperonin GroES (HSP10)